MHDGFDVRRACAEVDDAGPQRGPSVAQPRVRYDRDASSLQLRHRFPELDRTLDTQFGVEYRVGPYRVLRRKPLGA